MLLQLLFDFFGGKAKTRVYVTLLGWILILHIDILFIAILTDQRIIFEKTTQLKGEYVWSYIAHFAWWWTIAIEVARLVLAYVITYLMIWVIPKHVSAKSYRQELEVEYILRKMKVEKEEELNKREEVAVEQQLENIEKEKKVVVERAKLDDRPEQARWDSEFNDFTKARNGLDALNEIRNTVYGEGGNLSQYKDATGWEQTPKGVKANNLALADTNDLIVITDKGRMLGLTDKGKYFIKKLGNL